MKKKRSEKRENAYIIVFVIIVVAGMAIFLFNLIRGNNLYKPGPVFDFREYLEEKDYDPFYSFKMQELAEKINKAAGKTDEDKEKESEIESGIYFTKFFLQENPAETYNYINDFWKNVNASQDIKIEDLHANNCYGIEIPVENREQILENIKLNEDLKELKVIEPPVWDVCFQQAYYPEQIELMFASDDIKLLIEENEDDYIAKLENEVTEEELNQIEEMYSDVIKIEK